MADATINGRGSDGVKIKETICRNLIYMRVKSKTAAAARYGVYFIERFFFEGKIFVLPEKERAASLFLAEKYPLA